MGPIVAFWKYDELLLVLGTKCRLDEVSLGRSVAWTKCRLDEVSLGRIVCRWGQIVAGDVLSPNRLLARGWLDCNGMVSYLSPQRNVESEHPVKTESGIGELHGTERHPVNEGESLAPVHTRQTPHFRHCNEKHF